jgi:ABC-2 type transport system permease protein
VLLGVWVGLGLLFAYLLPYLAYRGNAGGPVQTPLLDLLPIHLVENLLAGFPFFGGVFALMLAVLTTGSDYGWDTLKTLLIQRPGRGRIFAAKLASIAVALVVFVVAIFAGGVIASALVAAEEGAGMQWPSAWELVRGIAAGWFVLATWASLGVMLAIATRGTALAIGLGILYALVIEGLLSALASEVAWLDGFVQYFLRANAYSLVTAIGVPRSVLTDNGPGSFFGPFVGAGQAVFVMSLYAACLIGVSAALLRRRDVS